MDIRQPQLRVLAVFGESCTGKSTLAQMLAQETGAAVYTGKDYLRLARNEQEARARFRALLQETGTPLIYVISEPEHLALLPQNCLRVLVTAELSTIQARFACRTGGVLPAPLAQALARRHGVFDSQPHDLHLHEGDDLQAFCAQIFAGWGT